MSQLAQPAPSPQQQQAASGRGGSHMRMRALAARHGRLCTGSMHRQQLASQVFNGRVHTA